MQKTYTVMQDELVAFRAKGAAQGVVIPPGDSGTVSFDGVTMSFLIAGTLLTLTIVSKPFFVPASVIWDHLAQFLPPANA